MELSKPEVGSSRKMQLDKATISTAIDSRFI